MKLRIKAALAFVAGVAATMWIVAMCSARGIACSGCDLLMAVGRSVPHGHQHDPPSTSAPAGATTEAQPLPARPNQSARGGSAGAYCEDLDVSR